PREVPWLSILVDAAERIIAVNSRAESRPPACPREMTMHRIKNFSGETRFSSAVPALRPLLSVLLAGGLLSLIFLVGAKPLSAQAEKRTVFTEDNFQWQGNLKAGQTLEVINRNGEIEASTAATGARVAGMRRDGNDDKELFIEVVEYS